MRSLIYLVLSVFELPFLVLAWIDYYWNTLCKALSGISIIFILPALLTMPITWLHSFTLPVFILLKQSISGINISYEDAMRLNLSRFPEL